MENNNINIEEIMAQIKREIKEKNLSSDMLSFEDVPYKKPVQISRSGNASLSDADETLAFMNAHYYVQPYKPITGNPIKVFIKKVIRKLTKFYVEPVVFEQNEFNANTVSVLNTLRNTAENQSSCETDSLAEKLETLKLAQRELLIRIETLEKENSLLKEEIAAGKQVSE